jgi:hypothetical protein
MRIPASAHRFELLNRRSMFPSLTGIVRLQAAPRMQHCLPMSGAGLSKAGLPSRLSRSGGQMATRGRTSAGVAQLVEHLFCKQKVRGSIPLPSSAAVGSSTVWLGM